MEEPKSSSHTEEVRWIWKVNEKKNVGIFTIPFNSSYLKNNKIVPIVHKQITPAYFSEFCDTISSKFSNYHLLQ